MKYKIKLEEELKRLMDAYKEAERPEHPEEVMDEVELKQAVDSLTAQLKYLNGLITDDEYSDEMKNIGESL